MKQSLKELWAKELAEDEYAAIGRVTCASADLELAFGVAIAVVANVSIPVAAAMFGGAMLDTKLTIFAKIFEMKCQKQPELLRELNLLISKMRANNEERNTATHGSWRMWDWSEIEQKFVETPAFAVHKRRGAQERRIDIAKTKALAARIKETRSDLLAHLRKSVPLLEQDSAEQSRQIADFLRHRVANSPDVACRQESLSPK